MNIMGLFILLYFNELNTQGYPFGHSIINSAVCFKIGTCEFRGSQLLIGRSTFSCTYYIVIIGGKMDKEAYFTGVDVDFDETYGNKLR